MTNDPAQQAVAFDESGQGYRIVWTEEALDVVVGLLATITDLQRACEELRREVPHMERDDGTCLSCGETWMCRGYVDDLAWPDADREGRDGHEV